PGTTLHMPQRFVRRSEAGLFESRAHEILPPEVGPQYHGRLSLTVAPPVWVSLTFGEAVVRTKRLDGSERELVFEVGDLARFSGTVRVRVLDAATGEEVTEGLGICHPSGSRSIQPRFEDGLAIFEGVPPGRVELTASVKRRSLRLAPERELHVLPGETLDLGSLILSQEGR
ncbi:MAG: hypothetical protein AAGG01_08085, partial [Planctomycetota bacterium]